MSELLIENCQGGLNTDLDPTKIKPNEAVVAKNIDPRDGHFKKLGGADDKFDSLPSSFTPLSAAEFLWTKPSAQQITIVYGTVGGADKLYVRPYVAAGAWVDDWLELTEAETSLTADAGTNTTTIVDAGLSAEDKTGWVAINTTRGGSALITSGTTTLALKQSITGQTTGDSYLVTRFPGFYDTSGNFLFAAQNSIVRFRGRENVIEIITGSDDGYSTQTDTKSDFWLGYISGGMFDDSDLDWDDMYCARNNLDMLEAAECVASTAVAAETDDPLPDSTSFIVLFVPLYDGFQEGALWNGNAPFDGTDYGGTTAETTGTNERIDINFSIPFGNDTADQQPLVEPARPLVFPHPLFCRRITKLLVYMAEISGIGASRWELSEDLIMVKEVVIDDSSWAGTGPYTQTVSIKGRDYANASGDTIGSRQGHTDLNINANAEFSAFVGQNLFLASVYTDKERPDIIIKSPTNSDIINTPDVKPWGEYIDVSVYGINRILGLYESLTQAVVIGENKILRIESSSTQTIVRETFVEKGGIAKKGIVQAGGIIYIAGLENIYSFATLGSYSQRGAILRKIGDRETQNGTKGGIRNEWLDFSVANRQAAVMGYDRNLNCVVLAVSTTIYLYFIDLDAWYTYDGIEDAVTWFTTGYDGELIALAGSTIKNMFSATPDVSNEMDWKTGVLPGPLRTNRIRMPYSGSDDTTIKLFDAERSTTNPQIAPVKFKAQSTVKRIPKEASGRFERFQLNVITDSSTNVDNEIEGIEIEHRQVQKK